MQCIKLRMSSYRPNLMNFTTSETLGNWLQKYKLRVCNAIHEMVIRSCCNVCIECNITSAIFHRQSSQWARYRLYGQWDTWHLLASYQQSRQRDAWHWMTSYRQSPKGDTWSVTNSPRNGTRSTCWPVTDSPDSGTPDQLPTVPAMGSVALTDQLPRVLTGGHLTRLTLYQQSRQRECDTAWPVPRVRAVGHFDTCWLCTDSFRTGTHDAGCPVTLVRAAGHMMLADHYQQFLQTDTWCLLTIYRRSQQRDIQHWLTSYQFVMG